METPCKAVVLQNEKDYSQLHLYIYVWLQPPDRVMQSFLITKSGKNGLKTMDEKGTKMEQITLTFDTYQIQ